MLYKLRWEFRKNVVSGAVVAHVIKIDILLYYFLLPLYRIIKL